MNYVSIGFGNIINKEKIVGILSPQLASTKLLVSKSRDDMMLIDVTTNRKIKSVIVTDSGYVFLCALAPETIMGRLNNNEENNER